MSTLTEIRAPIRIDLIISAERGPDHVGFRERDTAERDSNGHAEEKLLLRLLFSPFVLLLYFDEKNKSKWRTSLISFIREQILRPQTL
jgi:hypothetical protein